MLVFTDAGWEIEKETFANELLAEFDEILKTSQPPYDMRYLKGSKPYTDLVPVG